MKRPVDQTYNSSKNQDKFCRPLTLVTARLLESDIEKIKRELKELRQKHVKQKNKSQMKGKEMLKHIKRCAKRRYPHDPQYAEKFIEIAKKIVLSEELEQSLDYIPTS